MATYRIKRDGEVVLEGVHAVSEEAAVERAYIGWNRKVPKERIEAVEMK